MSKDRSIINSYYTTMQLEDLGDQWQNQTQKAQNEERYFFVQDKYVKDEIQQKIPIFHKAMANAKQGNPSKFMFCSNLGGGHWVGVSVKVENGKATIYYSDSNAPNQNYNYEQLSNDAKLTNHYPNNTLGQLEAKLNNDNLTPQEEQALKNAYKQKYASESKQIIDGWASSFEEAFGKENVTKQIYQDTWQQTNWLGEQEYGPNSCGPYALENMRRSLDDSKNKEQNPGSLVIRQRQLDQMQNKTGIAASSLNTKLLEKVRKFYKDLPEESLKNENILEILQDDNCKKAIISERNDITEESFQHTLSVLNKLDNFNSSNKDSPLKGEDISDVINNSDSYSTRTKIGKKLKINKFPKVSLSNKVKNKITKYVNESHNDLTADEIEAILKDPTSEISHNGVKKLIGDYTEVNRATSAKNALMNAMQITQQDIDEVELLNPPEIAKNNELISNTLKLLANPQNKQVKEKLRKQIEITPDEIGKDRSRNIITHLKNKYLPRVKAIEHSKAQLRQKLAILQHSMNPEDFTQYINSGLRDNSKFNIQHPQAQSMQFLNLWYVDSNNQSNNNTVAYSYQMLLKSIKTDMEILKPKYCDEVIKENFYDTIPPFVKMEEAKELKFSLTKIQNAMGNDFQNFIDTNCAVTTDLKNEYPDISYDLSKIEKTSEDQKIKLAKEISGNHNTQIISDAQYNQELQKKENSQILSDRKYAQKLEKEEHNQIFSDREYAKKLQNQRKQISEDEIYALTLQHEELIAQHDYIISEINNPKRTEDKNILEKKEQNLRTQIQENNKRLHNLTKEKTPAKKFKQKISEIINNARKEYKKFSSSYDPPRSSRTTNNPYGERSRF